MRTSSRAILTSPAFLLALGLLALNDWVLEPAFGNWITGKLSDFAGVFALPLLWCAFFPARRKTGFLLTAVCFMLWKSPLVEQLLAAWNSLGVLHLRRVVDYSDYVALVTLAPAYRIARHYDTGSLGAPPLSPVRRIGALASAFVAVLILAADSVAPPSYPLRDTSAYSIEASRSDVRNGLDALGFQIFNGGRDLGIHADTLALHIRQPPERDVHITIEVKDAAPSGVSLTLLAARAFGPPPNTSSLVQAFEKQVIAPLREWVASHGGTR
jgi:hypothetical protein